MGIIVEYVIFDNIQREEEGYFCPTPRQNEGLCRHLIQETEIRFLHMRHITLTERRVAGE